MTSARGAAASPGTGVAAPPTVVALRALGLGDFLTGVPALRGLAAAYPDHALVLAAPAALHPLAQLCGAVDRAVDVAPLTPLPGCLHGADVAVDLHGRGPQSHRVLLDAAPARLIAFAHPDVPESRDGPRWRSGEHEVTRWCRLLTEHGVPADPGRLELAWPGEPPVGARGATLVHPGAGSPARRWPPERWAAVARAEVASGRDVVVTGGPDEVGLAAAVARGAHLPKGAVLAGATDLATLARAVAAADPVLCGDTGVAHLATAFGVASVVLFGPTPPAEWGPPSVPWHRRLWSGVRGDPHAERPDPGLLSITVADVLAEVAALPDRAERADRSLLSG